MCQRPDVGIACPPGLTLSLAQQGLMPRLDTVTDGNCGIHAFIIVQGGLVARHVRPTNSTQPSNQPTGQPMSQSMDR